MHAIKKAARREAWYENEGDTQTYNPFGRLNAHRPLRRTSDLEQRSNRFETLHRVQTEGDAVSPVEENRRRMYDDDKTEFGPPQKSSTFSGDLPQSRERLEGLKDDRVTKEYHGGVEQSSNTPEVHSETALDVATGLNQPRKRKVRKFMPWKKDESDAVSEPETDTAVSNKKARLHITVVSQIKAIFGSWINVLLVLVPVGFAVNYTHQSPIAIFVLNFVAIIPISALLSWATDELALYVGEVLQGLLNITFSNAAQLISSIFLLKTRQIEVLKSSLLGGILQSVLLMPGLAFLFGGFRRLEQYFNVTVAQTMGMFLLLAVLSLVIPTVSQLWGQTTHAGILAQSRGTAIIIIFSYSLWLIFQLRTHRDMFHEPTAKAPKKPSSRRKSEGEAIKRMVNAAARFAEDEDEEEVPQLGRIGALATIIVSTTILAFHTEFATNSIQGLLSNDAISERFLGIVILPLLGNDLNVIACGIKDKLDLSLALSLHKAMQTALMVAPLVVLIAWGMSIDRMSLDFDGFSTAAMFASVIILTYVIQDGKSNWLTGALLIKVFLIVGVASFYVD